MIPERLAKLRAEMAKREIAIYIVPTADFHESEYVGEYFKARKYITGFTGSAGTAVITMTEAGLWTDGRYFVQAEQQLKGTTVTLFKMYEEGVPSVTEYVQQNLKEGQCIGFDGRVMNGALGEEFLEIAKERGGSLKVDEDLIDFIWEDRPAISKEPAWIFEQKYVGETTASKLNRVRAVMKEKQADIHILASLYDIAWLLNIRGNDIHCVPVVLSYVAISQDTCIWFVQEEVITEEIRAYLQINQIEIRPYHDIYAYAAAIPAQANVLLHRGKVNYRIIHAIPDTVTIMHDADPTEVMKAMKNPVELENIRKAHVKDAVSVCKFMYWLKTNVGKIPMTEISISDYLTSLRAQQEGFLDISFDTIAGYAAHGAIVHYSATPESDAAIEPQGMLLVDSGGHYMEGTTDITRTFILGPVTQEEKEAFTRVCRSNINLQAARFMYGCTGINLDYIAREPFWEIGMNYNHGTGHGVGYVLNVHEGPNGFRWKTTAERSDAGVLEEGMVTTDEPGIYIEGKYGIRTESELVTRKGEKNAYGQFMYFENLTYVPIDLDGIIPEMLSPIEKQRLNAYHANVYQKIAPFLTKEEAEFLKEYTRAI